MENRVSTRRRPLAALAGLAIAVEGVLPARQSMAAPRWSNGTAERTARAAAEADTVGSPRPGQHTSSDQTVTLHLLAVNDLHGEIAPSHTLNGHQVGGAAYLAAHINRRRARYPDRTLVVHVGDLVSASPAISGLLQDEPAVAIANAIGFDLGVVGNHEFDEGVSELFRLLDGGAHPVTMPLTGRFPGTRFPVLAANVVRTATGRPLLPPYRVITRRGIKVGFIGVVTTETPSGVGRGVDGLTFLDEAATVNHYARELRGQGVRTIVVLAHLGGIPTATGAVHGPIANLAQTVADTVDVILSGHTHRAYATTIAGKLVTQAWAYGVALADIALTIDCASGRVVEKTAELVPTLHDTVPPDPAITALVSRYTALAAPLISEPVGVAARAFTRSCDRPGEQSLGDLIADAYRWRTGADLALSHPGWNWADIAAGAVTLGDLYLIQPANDDLVTVRLTGAQIMQGLEQQWQTGQTTMLQISGLEIAVDPQAPFGRRVVEARLTDGQRLDPTAHYVVAINGLLAGGGGGFTAFQDGIEVGVGPKDLATLVDYIRHLPRPFGPVGGRRKLISTLETQAA